MDISFTGTNLLSVLLLFAAGLVFIIKGGDWFVDAATWIAEAFGIPKFIVGATVVSFATTLPEMLVSVFAALEGNADIAVGNAVGSVTANVGLIMCLSLVCMPCLMTRKQFGFKAGLLLATIAVLFAFTRNGQLSVLQSVVILLFFVAFLAESLIAGKREQGTEASEDRPELTAKTIAQNLFSFVLGAAAIVLGAQLLIDNGSALAQMIGVPDSIIAATMIAHRHVPAGTGHDPDRHPQKGILALRGQHHRREYHGSDADHAALRADSGQADDDRASGHAAGYSRLSGRHGGGAGSGAGERQVQALDGLPYRRAVYRLSGHHVHLFRGVIKKRRFAPTFF